HKHTYSHTRILILYSSCKYTHRSHKAQVHKAQTHIQSYTDPHPPFLLYPWTTQGTRVLTHAYGRTPLRARKANW
uniref:Uncharacterized protein n=1 Tax=Aegilops tauschii subsp. strangulata TaxID=200361 RepID=A0A453GTE2_AEGTS